MECMADGQTDGWLFSFIYIDSCYVITHDGIRFSHDHTGLGDNIIMTQYRRNFIYYGVVHTLCTRQVLMHVGGEPPELFVWLFYLLDVIHKTLPTQINYTYCSTLFQESTASFSSRVLQEKFHCGLLL